MTQKKHFKRSQNITHLYIIVLIVTLALTLINLALMSHSNTINKQNANKKIQDQEILTRVAIRITTWNVANREPEFDLNLSSLFDDSVRQDKLNQINQDDTKIENEDLLRPHLQVIGLQEAPHLSLANPKLLFSDPWTMNLTRALQPLGYILYKQHRLSGIFLYVFVRYDMLLNVRDFETESVKTGFGGLLGNKGGVSLRFTLNGNSFCMTTSHLAAHQEYLQQRIEDYNTIMDNTKFLIDSHTTNILTHDYSFWFGDLNFRLDYIERGEVLNLITRIRTMANDEKSNQEKLEIIKKLLNENDQLVKVRRKLQIAFHEFEESEIGFLPTYKYRIGSVNSYDSDARTPAWTDRILYRHVPDAYYMMKNVTLDLQQLFYDTHPQYIISDHKPVSALFTAVTFNPRIFDNSTSPLRSIVEFEPIESWNVNQDGQAWFSITEDAFKQRPKVLSTWDRIGLYKANFGSVDDYLTIVFNNNLARTGPSYENTRSIPYQESPPSSPVLSIRGQRGRIFFSAVIPDDAILIPGQYKLLYLKATPAHELNIVGISNEFPVLSRSRSPSQSPSPPSSPSSS